MRRVFRVSLSLLLTCLLLLTATPNLMAQVDEQLSWEIPYQYSPNNSFPPPDHLPTYLGINRTDLSAEAMLAISLEKGAADAAQISATLTVGEQVIELSGQGTYGRYEQTPLQHGTFDVETEAGVAGKLYLQVYPNANECAAILAFGEGTAEPASIAFGDAYGNIVAIATQWNDYAKTLVKLPKAYELDGQPLMLEPAPYIADNQVLVPLRPLLRALGATVSWDAGNQAIKARKGDISLQLSLPNQTLKVNGNKPQPLTIAQPEGGSSFCPLEPLAEALGATVVDRRDTTVSLISQEQTQKEQGIFQITFVAGQNVILQNDTNRPYDLSEWNLSYYDPFAETGPMQEFRFPHKFVLKPGEQVQVAAGLATEPDNKHVFAWEYDQNRGPGKLRMTITALEPGRESISISNGGPDLYVGNWRLVNAAGKPAFDLPSVWLPQNQMLGVNGSPGKPSGPYELRWPNLPAIDKAYEEKQAQQAESARESAEKVRQGYLPVMEALDLDMDDYIVYSTVGMFEQFNTGDLEPFGGNAAASRSLQYADWRLTRPLLEMGDTVPAYIINRNGQEAYIALIKRDGTYIAYHLELVIDDGYYTWIYDQVLPE